MSQQEHHVAMPPQLHRQLRRTSEPGHGGHPHCGVEFTAGVSLRKIVVTRLSRLTARHCGWVGDMT